MTVLITGAGGFVGINVLEALLAQGREIVAFSDRPLPSVVYDHLGGLGGRLTLVIGDVRDRRLLAETIARHQVRRILHAAAITLGPKSAIATATDAFDVNTVSTAVLLEEGRRAGIDRFVYPSSSAVYGDAAFGTTPLTERVAPAPLTLYGFTKLASERLVAEAARALGLSTVIARITALFGPWEHDTGVRETLSPPFQIASRIVGGKPLVLAERGERDWTSSADIAKALALLLTAESLPHDLYNLSLSQTWNARLLGGALASRFPGARLSTMPEPHGEGAVAYNDDLKRSRVPLSAARFARDFGFRFMTAAEAVAHYASWIEARGPRFLDIRHQGVGKDG
jgi:nucleoside-diphosphate-sugar epimerase